jgi:integrase
LKEEKMRKNAAKKQHRAEVIHPVTGARRRLAVGSYRDKRLLSSVSLVREDELNRALGQMTFAEAAHNYRERLVAENKLEAAKRLDAVLRLHLLPVMGTMVLRRTTPSGIAIIADELRARVVSMKTHRGHLNWMCVILRNAFGDLKSPVAYASDIPNRRERAAYGTAGLAKNPLPIPFGRPLADRLDRSAGVLRILLHLLIHAGLRIGEALALTRADIDFAHKKGPRINVSLSMRPDRTLGVPKTPSGLRAVPINSALKAEILTWFDAIKGPRHMQLISDDPDKIYSYNQVSWMHRDFQSGLDGELYGFHRYRAACVTTWLLAGIRLNDLIGWIGHADLRTTIETYCHAVILAEELWRAMHPDGSTADGPETRVFSSVTQDQ